MFHTPTFNNPLRPLFDLLNPRQYTRVILLTFVLAVLGATVAIHYLAVPVWGAVASVLLSLLLPAIPKWLSDRQRYGSVAMVLCILVAAQGFHTVEHVSQWIQYHILRWPAWQAAGLISPANAEWVHFGWNWTVLVIIVYLVWSGVRNPWAWLLLIWASAHTLEHSYMTFRYVQTLQELSQLGVSNVAAQGLPGFFGRDGWLASSQATQNTFLCRLPGFTTAPRLDVHFWWNLGEVLLLIPATNIYMAGIISRQGLEARGAMAEMSRKLA